MSKFFWKKLFSLISIVTISFFSLVFATNNVVGIKNIKHAISNKTVTLSRNITSGNNQADMFLWNEDTKIFKFISTIDTFQKQTSLQATKNGNYVVRFIPSGGGNDVRYTFSVSGLNMDSKDISAVPKTGTTSNILLILGLSVLLYTFYRYKKVSKR